MKRYAVLAALVGAVFVGADPRLGAADPSPEQRALEVTRGWGKGGATSDKTGAVAIYQHELTDQMARDLMQHRAGLGHLRELQLSRSPLTDAGMKEIYGLPSLETLVLEGVGVSDAGVAALKEVPKLKLLS